MTQAPGAQPTAAIHACVDCMLKSSLTLTAANKAIDENSDNMPRAGANTEPRLGVVSESAFETFGAILTGRQWKNGRVLRVRHLNGDPAVHRLVEPVAKIWEQFANITFDFVESGPAELRISYNDDGQSWSNVGTDALSIADPEPTMHYGWLTATTEPDEVHRVVIHEFGHALGMIHEQSQPTQDIHWNTDAVYRYYAKQGWDKSMVDSNVLFKYSKQQTQFTAYDPASIMQYPIPAGLTLDGVTIGWNRELSPIDKAFIAQIYPKPAPPVPNDVQRAPGQRVAAEAPVTRTWEPTAQPG